jgi:ribosomal protein L13
MDMGSRIIVVNAEKVVVTGRKETDKLYKRHTNGLPGSMKVETFQQLQARAAFIDPVTALASFVCLVLASCSHRSLPA